MEKTKVILQIHASVKMSGYDLKLFIEISLVMHTNDTAYQYLVHESNISDIHKNTIMESRNASFFENVFLCK